MLLQRTSHNAGAAGHVVTGMTLSPTHRRRLTAAAFALLTATLVPGLTQLPAVAGSAAAPSAAELPVPPTR